MILACSFNRRRSKANNSGNADDCRQRCAVSQGINHYKAFVSVDTPPGTNPSLDKYQKATLPEEQDIGLSNLMNGGVTPVDGHSVHFIVVAYDAAPITLLLQVEMAAQRLHGT